jgi:dihydrolipoamide dehydrogenase
MSKTIDIKIPDIGDFDNVPVIEILVAKGDQVEKDQSLITLESEKATMEIPSPESGTIKSLDVSEGDHVAKGAVIGTIEVSEDSGQSDETEKQPDKEKQSSEETQKNHQ